MKRIGKAVIALSITGLTMVGSIATASMPWEARADKAKADYLFLEALRQKTEGNNDAYYELVDRALTYDPNDDYLCMESMMGKLMLSPRDSATKVRTLEAMHIYTDKNPDDYDAATKYVSLATYFGVNDYATEAWEKIYRTFPDRPEVSTAYADHLYEQGDTASLESAMKVYDQLEVSEGISPQLLSRKMRVYLAKEDTAAVLSEAHRLLASSPNSTEYHVFLGRLFQDLGYPDSAIMMLDKAAELDSASGLVYYYRANYYKDLGDTTAYEREVKLAMLQSDLDLEPKLNILRAYAAEVYTDSALVPTVDELFRNVIAQYPHDDQARLLYAEFLIATNNYQDAAEQMSYSLDANPADEQRWQALAGLYNEFNNFQKGIEVVEKGLHYFPKNIQLYHIGSMLASKLGDKEKTIGYNLRGLNQVDSTDLKSRSDFVTGMADAYYNFGDPDSAFIYYNIALNMNPDNSFALNNAAYHMALENRDLDTAEKYARRATLLDPESGTNYDTYAWVMFAKGEYKRAKELIDLSLRLLPEEEQTEEVLEHAGDIYFMNQDTDRALDFWQEALQLDPDNELLQRKVKNKTFFYK